MNGLCGFIRIPKEKNIRLRHGKKLVQMEISKLYFAIKPHNLTPAMVIHVCTRVSVSVGFTITQPIRRGNHYGRGGVHFWWTKIRKLKTSLHDAYNDDEKSTLGTVSVVLRPVRHTYARRILTQSCPESTPHIFRSTLKNRCSCWQTCISVNVVSSSTSNEQFTEAFLAWHPPIAFLV